MGGKNLETRMRRIEVRGQKRKAVSGMLESEDKTVRWVLRERGEKLEEGHQKQHLGRQ